MTLLFLAVLVGSNIFLSRKIGWIFSMEHLAGLHVVFAVIPVFMIAGLIGLSNATGTAGHLLYGLAAILTGLMLYLVLSFLLTEAVHLIIPLGRTLYGISVFSITAVVVVYGLINARQTKFNEVEVPVAGLDEEVKILHLSDIHIGHFRGRDFLQKLVDISEGTNPDLVVITGDLFDGRYHLSKESLEPLRQFRVPVYFVEGNHDGYTGVEKIKAMLRETGVRVLENEIVMQGQLQLVGLDHMRADQDARAMHAMQEGGTIRGVLQALEIDSDQPSVLLHHSPDGIEYAHEQGIDLYLAGHTHAGQLFPVNYINELLFKYNKGLSDYHGTRIFVSQGAGTFGPPMRVGTNGEITLIQLKKAQPGETG